jgi:peptidoglycan/LPS O-acetylase OafA/YrhL
VIEESVQVEQANPATTAKPRLYSVDAMRLVMALSVVVLHVGVFGYFEKWGPIAKLAVPFFLGVQGYFLYKPGTGFDRIAKSVKTNSIKLVKIFAGSYALVVACNITYGLFIQTSNSQIQVNVEETLRFIFSTDNLYKTFWLGWLDGGPGFGVLWYLTTATYCYLAFGLFLWLKSRFKIGKFAFPGDWVLLVFSLAMFYTVHIAHYYNEPLQWAIQKNPKFLFDGLVFVAAGYFAHKLKDVLDRIPLIIILVGLGAVCWSNWHECIVTGDFHDTYTLASPVLIFLLMNVLIRLPKLGGKHLATAGRRYTLNIYIIHCLVWYFIFHDFFKQNDMPVDQYRWVSLSAALIVFLVSLGISIVYQFAKDKIVEKFHPKFIHSTT